MAGLTPKQAAAELGKTVQTLFRWRQAKKGPPYRIIEGRVQYPTIELRNWLESKWGRRPEEAA